VICFHSRLVIVGTTDQKAPAAGPAQVGAGVDDSRAIRDHVDKIIQSDAFKSSHRSQRFLEYVVSKMLEGRLDDLKERSIGIALFGRTASYNTGEDAIVRVTASDVRKRLLQYYGQGHLDSKIRILLPSGSYLPEIRRSSDSIGAAPSDVAGVAELTPAFEQPESTSHRNRRWPMSAVILILLAFVCGVVVSPSIRWLRFGSAVRSETLPWKALFQAGRRTVFVVSDTNIAMLENVLGIPISLGDYANRQYVQDPASLNPELRRLLGHLAGNDYSASMATVDLRAALTLTHIAQAYSVQLTPHSARMMRLQDFKTDDNFILMGSPLSNPWAALFQDRLDFVWEFDRAQKKEICRNRHPRKGELAVYDPNATLFKSGDAFAIVAFLVNPEEKGHVLLLGGSNAEATESAVRFITDSDLFGRMMASYKINVQGPPRNFEVLLHVRTMAGESTSYDVLSVHVPAGPARN
jgi:hypothetical protein